MKKFLLGISIALLAFGCASTDTSLELESDIAALQRTLDSYNNACGKVAFQPAREALEEAQEAYEDGDYSEAEIAYLKAENLYDEELGGYENAIGSIDKMNGQIRDQKSRLSAVRADAQKYAPQEYAASSARINSLHSDAQSEIASCDVVGAESSIEEAEKELRYLEDITFARMNAAQVTPVVTNQEVYTVVKGDSLWKIAARKYSNPYFWPLIYWSNQSSIKDPDLIFPNQKLTIDYGYDADKKTDAEKTAKTRGPWSLYDGK